MNKNDDRIIPGLNIFNDEYILCAAIWYNDNIKRVHQPKNIDIGIVVCGRRHHNCLSILYSLLGEKYNSKLAARKAQGFLTSYDRFVNREEAGKIAFEIGQIKEETDCLFSEDLY
jgi:hypothetical protein